MTEADVIEPGPLKIQVNWSWLILGFLVVWSLATGYFPTFDVSLSSTTYWLMAAISVLGLFLSIVFHEICHSLMARKFGLGGKTISLFVFGGVSDIEKEPTSPGIEFTIAIVGPLFSAFLGLILAWLDNYGLSKAWPVPVIGTLYYLSTINYALAIFNMIPAFPLDGGRVFRSILWAWKKDVQWATKIASNFGSGFAMLLMIFGVLNFLSFNFLNGLWFFFLGMFLLGLAKASYSQILIAKLMGHESVEKLMKKTAVTTVSPDESLREFADDIYFHRSKFFPVVEDEKLLGCVEIKDLKRFPQDQWTSHRVREVVAGCSSQNVISPNSDVLEAIKIMNRNKRKELIVAEQGRLLGIISLNDIIQYLMLKMEIEGTSAA